MRAGAAANKALVPLLLVLLLPLPSLAQSDQQAAPPQTDNAAAPQAPAQVPTIPVAAAEPAQPTQGAQQLDDIVVTAQRVAQSEQKAAVPLKVVQGEDISKAGIVNMTRLSEKVPGLITSPATTFIRGVGTFSFLSYTDPAIAFNYDGVYIGRATSTGGLFYDLERIEALKGPQGTLYGRNATGGALNVYPAQPRTGESTAFVNAGYGDYNAYNVEAAANQAIGDTSAIRIAGLYARSGGFLSDGGSDKDIRSVRVQGLSDFGESLSVRIAADFSHSGGFGEGRRYAGEAQYDKNAGAYNFRPANLGPGQGIYSPSSQAFRSTIFVPQVGRNLEPIPTTGIYSALPQASNDFYGVNSEVNWTTRLGTVTVVPAWRHYTLDSVIGNHFPAHTNDSGDQHSLEARVSGNRGMFDYTAGAYYFDERIASDLRVNTSALFIRQLSANDTKSGAAFARVTAHLTDSLRLVGGARYTKDKKGFNGDADVLVMVCTSALGGQPNCPTARLFQLTRTLEEQPFVIPARGQQQPVSQGPEGTIIIRQTTDNLQGISQSRPTYRGALEYDLAENSLLYGSLETGFRSGGFSIATGYETYKPEEITAYTLGSKNRFFHGAVEVNAEAFDWTYADQQLGYVGTDAAGKQNFIIQNIGKSSIRGIELDGRAIVTSSTRLGVDLQYLDAVYTAFEYEAPIVQPLPAPDPAATPPPPRLGCPFAKSASGTSYHVNCNGRPAFNSPKWTLNLSAAQTVSLSSFDLVLDASTQYRTAYFVGFEYLPEQRTDPVWRSNLRLSLVPAAAWAGLTVSAWIRNIENRQPITFSFPVGNIESEVDSEPRTIGLTLTSAF